jgi:hypothetical protein
MVLSFRVFTRYFNQFLLPYSIFLNSCINNPCENNGTCSVDVNGNATCTCDGNWNGTYCQGIVTAYMYFTMSAIYRTHDNHSRSPDQNPLLWDFSVVQKGLFI